MARHALQQAGADRLPEDHAATGARHSLLGRWRLVHDGPGAPPEPHTTEDRSVATGPQAKATPTRMACPWHAAFDA